MPRFLDIEKFIPEYEDTDLLELASFDDDIHSPKNMYWKKSRKCYVSIANPVHGRENYIKILRGNKDYCKLPDFDSCADEINKKYMEIVDKLIKSDVMRAAYFYIVDNERNKLVRDWRKRNHFVFEEEEEEEDIN